MATAKRMASASSTFETVYRAAIQPIVRRVIPQSARQWVNTQLNRFDYSPPRGLVQFGQLRRLTPICPHWGFGRGSAVDRYYIERFLGSCADDIRGRVLEIAENTYTRRFGGERVTHSDVLHVEPGNPAATIVADLTLADDIQSDTFDCIILTQTIQMIYDVRAAIRTLHRILRPGGVVLATTHGISKISMPDMSRWGEYWRFTSRSAARLFEEVFGAGHVSVKSDGNVLTAAAFLYGLAAEDLKPAELDHQDPAYELLVTIRAVKAPAGVAQKPADAAA